MVIRGRPRGGPPPEVALALSNVTAPRVGRRPNPANPADPGTEEEPYGWEAREFLRYVSRHLKILLTNWVHCLCL